MTTWLEQRRPGHFEDEEQALFDVALLRDDEVKTTTAKQLMKNKTTLAPGDFVSGGWDTIHAALHQLGKSIPVPNDYPEPIRDLLYRDVWPGKLRELEQYSTVFVKPRSRAKRFTGTLAHGFSVFYGVSQNLDVWFSTPVVWLSEFRVFVSNHTVLGICHYSGNSTILPDRSVIDSAVSRLHDRAGYALDVGVLDSGKTAVVEVNDGFSLGRYGLAPELYDRVLRSRWTQLIA